ncbi:MAG: dTDP-glucose 4,6-dehydratase [Nitrospirae bacterium RIFCSPLOWO2_02_42_7]|nr:MAG: dTDP-glucose 4,6-dehydratase [Nitrospirae bacterium RIFCSPLOWO2_02_42_7]
MKLLVTGGAGFIGSNFIRYMIKKYPDYKIINLDKLTYAGNLDNLKDIEDHPNYTFVRGDICDVKSVAEAAAGVDAILNFAAETHVDRSILEPGSFIQTDIYGTYVLLETVKSKGIRRYIQVSTDEVYGSIDSGSFTEDSPLSPSSPYSASKAGGDMLVYSYWHTYHIPVIITRSSNNYGPYQYPEKLIPLFITNALEDNPLPLYGDGLNVRDWIFVLDNCEAIDIVLHKGKDGEVYNIGGGNERTNIEITDIILRETGRPESLIKYIKDRPGHDRRYSIDSSKIKSLGFSHKYSFEEAMCNTIKWYKDYEWWWKKVKSDEFKRFYKKAYGEVEW